MYILATALILSTSLVGASPIVSPVVSGKIDTAMPFLSQATEWPTSSQVWWTPDASQSQWDWKTWSQSSASSTVLAVSTSSATAVQSTPIATSTSVVSPTPYSNPFTIYTTMTNSAGVITGMPAVVTSQPTQAAKATECAGCTSVKSDQASWSSMVSSIYSAETSKAAAVSVSSSSGPSSASSPSTSTTSAGFSQSTNAASRREIFNCGAALAIFGAFACLL